MIPGEWYIEDFKIPWVVTASYSENKIDVSCLAFKDSIETGSDPREEIAVIDDFSSFPASQTLDLQGGLYPQSLFRTDPLTLTDGCEVYKGFISSPTFKEDSKANMVIEYKFTVIIWNEVTNEGVVIELEDGDEIEYDDDWELGYESYTPPMEEEEEETVLDSAPVAPIPTSVVSVNTGSAVNWVTNQ